MDSLSFSSLSGYLLATAITLAIFSRAFGVKSLFRWTSRLLLGAGAGYVAAVVLRQVLLPTFTPGWLDSPLQFALTITAVLLSLLLALRFAPRPEIRAWGLLPLGMLAGVGGALALAGIMRGTLLPQLMAVKQLSIFPRFPILNILSVVIATLTSLGVLLYLLPGSGDVEPGVEKQHWGVRLLHAWRLWGYWALMLALGALLASTAGARITLLIDRIQFLLGFGGL